MRHLCPRCLSEQIETKDHARKAAGVVGFVGGAASGFSKVRSGAEVGAAVGSAIGIIAGPIGPRLGYWIGATVGAMVGGITGALAGAQLGHVIDERLLDNYHCLICDHQFRVPLEDDPAPSVSFMDSDLDTEESLTPPSSPKPVRNDEPTDPVPPPRWFGFGSLLTHFRRNAP